jgi:hypothetical protein
MHVIASILLVVVKHCTLVDAVVCAVAAEK